MTIDDVNALDRDGFVARIGPVFEESPWIAGQTWEARPFSSREELLEALCATVRSAEPERRVALIRAHPDLAGRLAGEGALTAESTREQAAAGLTGAGEEVKAELRERNRRYRERFGFPFVICARLNRVETILAAFEERLGNSRETEIGIAIDEIFRIARLRLFDLVPES